jgi:hypothetical protein
MNYRIVYLPFPEDVRGCVRLMDDGSYIIGINSALSDAEKEKTLRHELEHIRRDHFHDPRPIWEIEREAAEA